jgi:hypothetical protein
LTRNAVNSEVIFRSTKERVHELMASPLPEDPLELLARTQALLLYQLMWVFSPDPRAVESAEETRPAAAEAARALLRHIYFEEALHRDGSETGVASSYSLHHLLVAPPTDQGVPGGTTLFQQQPLGTTPLFQQQQQQPQQQSTDRHDLLVPVRPHAQLSTSVFTNNYINANNNNELSNSNHAADNTPLNTDDDPDPNADADAADAAWRAWIFHESARRTFLCVYYWSQTWDKITGCTCPEAARLLLARRHDSFTMAARLWHARDARGFAAAWAEGRRFVVVDRSESILPLPSLFFFSFLSFFLKGQGGL